jgi:hypothetical protein
MLSEGGKDVDTVTPLRPTPPLTPPVCVTFTQLRPFYRTRHHTRAQAAVKVLTDRRSAGSAQLPAASRLRVQYARHLRASTRAALQHSEKKEA